MNQKKLPSIKKKTGEIKLVQPSMKVQLSDKNNNNTNIANANNMNLFTNSNSKNKTNIATSQVISKSNKKDNINSKISTSTSTVIPKSNIDDKHLKDKKQSKLSETIKSTNNSHFNKLKDSKLNMINVANISVSDNINLNDFENIKMDDVSSVIKPSFNNNIRPHNNEFSEDSFMTIKLKDISALDFKNNPKIIKDNIVNIPDPNSSNKDNNDKDNKLSTLNKSPNYNFDETINFNINVNKSKSSNIKYIGNYPDSSNNFSLEESNVNKSLMSQTFSGFPNNSVLEELNKQNHNNYNYKDNKNINITKDNNNISNLISNSLNKSHNETSNSQVNHTQLITKINKNDISNNNSNNNYMNNTSMNNITSQFNNNTTRFSPENREILNPGDLIYEDKIKIIELLGKGAQAHVYLGEIIELNKNIAIKRYCIYDIKSNELNKIIEECETFKKLDHPHILKYYDLEYFYHELENLTEINLIMDYVEGSTLREYMDLTKDNCDINNIKIIGRCILEGLAYLHENGVLHRDLKVS